MSSSHYQELDKLIREYEEDSKLIRSDKLIIINYPKVLTMSAASSFEYYLKERINDFVASPKQPIATNYPQINTLMRQHTNKPMADKIYAKLIGVENNGLEVLDASKFYALFGGVTFVTDLTSRFVIEKTRRKAVAEGLTQSFLPLLGTNDKIDEEYAKQSEISDRLDVCTFDIAEKAFLSLKLRRNKVAHNYLHGLSDSFGDIRAFYYDAISYVVALEEAIKNLTA